MIFQVQKRFLTDRAFFRSLAGSIVLIMFIVDVNAKIGGGTVRRAAPISPGKESAMEIWIFLDATHPYEY